MSPQKPLKKSLKPLLLLCAAVMIGLGMLRLGIWQLDRAAEKQAILDQVKLRASSTPQGIETLVKNLEQADSIEAWSNQVRFQPVTLTGRYQGDQSILIDNQVMNNQGGYLVVTPFEVQETDTLVMVSRGWIAAGSTREDLPSFYTPEQTLSIRGRLNSPPQQPPLWKDGYPVNDGVVWQYLPIEQYAEQNQAQVLPLVVELAPDDEGSKGLLVRWQSIDDHWVAKHKGYAFQWFSMAIAFCIACLVLVIKTVRARD